MARIVVWDVDGTLYQSNEKIQKAHENVYASLLEKKTGSSYSEIKDLYNTRKARYKSSTLAISSLSCGSITDVAKYHEANLHIERYIKKDRKLINLFKKLYQITHIAYRNGTTKETKKIIRTLGLNEIKKRKAFYGPFDFVWGVVTEIGVCKPGPLAFDYIKTKIFNKYIRNEKNWDDIDGDWKKEVLFIGDRPEVDLKQAKENGFKTALVWADPTIKIPYVDHIFRSVYEVERILL
jgi:FMN phosphatase YigB (HAD superfamily)